MCFLLVDFVFVLDEDFMFFEGVSIIVGLCLLGEGDVFGLVGFCLVWDVTLGFFNVIGGLKNGRFVFEKY